MRETLTRGGGVVTPRVTSELTAAIAALGALALGAVLLTPDAANSIPTSGPVPVSGLPAVIAAAVSGAAVAFAAFGQRARRRLSTNTWAAVVYVPGTWVLTSRWVYEHLHMIEAIDLGGLLRIESAFDVALIVGAAAMAWAFATKARDQRHP